MPKKVSDEVEQLRKNVTGGDPQYMKAHYLPLETISELKQIRVLLQKLLDHERMAYKKYCDDQRITIT